MYSDASNNKLTIKEAIRRAFSAIVFRKQVSGKTKVRMNASEGPIKTIMLSSIANYSVRMRAEDVRSQLAPKTAIGRQLVRMGKHNDGGYVFLDHLLDNTIAYSCGISNDVSWDVEIAQRGTEIFQYDHTIPEQPLSHPQMHWFKTGIAETRGDDDSLKTIEELMTSNGHLSVDDIILKMDIEGHEWGALQATPAHIMKKFSQIIIELHALDRLHEDDLSKKILETLYHINKTHQSVHIHANNYGPAVMYDGVFMPATLEVTFARRADHRFEPCLKVFPTEMDMPCNPDAGDIDLGAIGAYAK